MALSALCGAALIAVDASASTPAVPGTYALSLPSNALGASQSATLTSLSCTAPNTCVAVGSYRTSTGNVPLIATETNGVWPHATALSPPSDAVASAALPPNPVTELLGVACPALGDCVAVGTYQVGATEFAPMVAMESAGIWGALTRVSPPSTSSPRTVADLDAVTCTGVGACEAVGAFTKTNGSEEAWSIADVDGAWSSPLVPALPNDALSVDQQAVLYSIACPTRTWCNATGSYQSETGVKAMSLTQSSGSWGSASTAAAITLPGDAVASDDANTALTALACPRARTCAAVGNYTTTTGTVAPMEALEVDGTWSAAAAVAVPTLVGATGTLVAQFDAVSCTSVSACTAVGSYGTTLASAPDTTVDSGGTWSHATTATVPSSHHTTGGYGIAGGVACFTATQCLSVGQYATTVGTEVYASVPATAPSAPQDLSARFSNEKVTLRWSTPAYTGLDAITGYTVVASPGGGECTTTTILSCGISGLTNGQLYSFALTATNAAGTSSAAVARATPAARPSAPALVSVRALTGGIQIVLRAPTHTGGDAISAYEYSLTGAAPWRTPSTKPTRHIITVTGLSRHHHYVVAVRAVTLAGPGPRSRRVPVTTK